jgi:hypothetical protein
MKRIIMFFIITSLAIVGLPTVQAGAVNKDQALQVAKNWVSYIVHRKGSWGGAIDASVLEVLEFQRNNRTIGYFCPVQPQGYVVISLLRELVPVKAYSTSGDLDPTSEEGMADLLKTTMMNLLDQTIAKVGPLDTANQQDLQNFLGITCHRSWEEIEQGVDMNYAEGDTLVDSFWHQGDPYYDWCPAPPPGSECTEPHCVVGCVATAGAQIMRYWCWPPYGVPAGWNDSYDWVNMPLGATPSSPQVQIDAVAELSSEVGIAVGMSYCSGTGEHACESSATTAYMVGVYSGYFRYHSGCGYLVRPDWDQATWFQFIKDQLNLNRPIQYRVVGHSIVCDGWREIGSAPLRQYHMNYGWANNATTWYSLDSLHLGNPAEEYMVLNIVPVTHLGASLAGTYPLDRVFPYRYFDLDASGTVATFEAGQYLQSLPGIKISCATGSGNNVRILSSSSQNTRLFTRGNTAIGAKLTGGGIKLSPNGGLKLY